VAERQWPSARIETRQWYLNPGRLQEVSEQTVGLTFSSPLTTGTVAGEWCAFGADGEMPLDQRADDGRSLSFESAELAESMEILGAPVVELELAAIPRRRLSLCGLTT
jgi:predicted acyl esterase